MNGHLNINPFEEIKKLSMAERILLVQDIWDSIFSSAEDLPIADEQKKELDSRLETYQHNPKSGKSWKDVRDNIRTRL